ncbi:MAG: NAD(P)H-dependent oxidoreductase [archaeon]
MKRGLVIGEPCLNDCSKKPIKVVGVMCSKREEYACAKEDPINLELLKIALSEAEKAGAKIELIDLRHLQIGACKECYSTCPAQCRYDEENNQCDCYTHKTDGVFVDDNTLLPLDEAYDRLPKKDFFKAYNSPGDFVKKDEMWKVYKALYEADGIIFSTSTSYYSRPALLQNMFSRLCALDGGVEKLWGDGKNLENSVKYALNKKAFYKQRLYGKHVAFINVSKEGDSVSPDLMKACTMMGMKILPLGVAYAVSWYDDSTHRNDKKKVLSDKYALNLTRRIGSVMVREIKRNERIYGIKSKTT